MHRFLALLAFFTAASRSAFAADFNFATATNQLGLDLYRTLAAQRTQQNLVISPYSIESALALVHAGADGETRTELSRVLGLATDENAVGAAVAELRRALEEIAEASRNAAATQARYGGKRDIIEWHAANRLFGEDGYAFRQSFLSLMKNDDGYAAPFQALEFRASPERARGTVNAWVEEQTRRKIHDLIPPGGVTSSTRLVLVNALYLKAPWQTPFVKTATQPRTFHVSEDNRRDVPTMQRTAFLGYTTEEGATIVTLDYTGNGLQFVIVLPDAGTSLDALAAKLTPAHFARWAKLGDGKRPSVALSFPRFRVKGSTIPLGTALRTLGVRSAFDEPRGSANFERIALRNSDDYLALSEVFHQTFIAVDEEGTEAAAATAATMLTLGAVALPQQPIEVRVDRPFLFAIQHRASGVCLFLGRIGDPR
jgi:serpin B